MVEVKNIQICGLNRSLKAISNSYSVGEINTLYLPDNDIVKIAKKLGNDKSSHQSHDAFLKGILVSFDLKGNGVFMPEFQRYHHIEIIMSQSTMHSMDKFMTSDFDPFTKYITPEIKELIKKYYNEWKVAKSELVDYSNAFYKKHDILIKYSKEEARVIELKENVYKAFEKLVHNLPRGLELWATCTTNYLQLKTIVIQRFHHKNKEDWSNFIKFCYSLENFRKLCGFEDSEWDLNNW